jgi:hypothetical protein
VNGLVDGAAGQSIVPPLTRGGQEGFDGAGTTKSGGIKRRKPLIAVPKNSCASSFVVKLPDHGGLRKSRLK